MWRAAIICLVILAVDQASKYYVLLVLNILQVGPIDVLPPVLNLRVAWNQGINFGIFGDHGQAIRFLLIALALGISLWVWLWASGRVTALRAEGSTRAALWIEASAGATIGGALGNALDRAIHGAVFDFLNTSCCGINNPFVYNVADIMIFAGVAGLIMFGGAPGKPRDVG